MYQKAVFGLLSNRRHLGLFGAHFTDEETEGGQVKQRALAHPGLCPMQAPGRQPCSEAVSQTRKRQRAAGTRAAPSEDRSGTGLSAGGEVLRNLGSSYLWNEAGDPAL